MNPLVSILIPSYNHKQFITELLISITNQTYTNIEIVIVDDGSSDGSVELLTSIKDQYNFRLIIKDHSGLCSAINTGLDYLSGEFVVIIASDDFMPTYRIYDQVSIMQRTDFDVIAGGITTIDLKSNIISYIKPKKIGELFFNELLKKNLIYAPSAMFRRDVFDRYSRYNAKWIVEDYPMWLRISYNKGRIANFDFSWAYYRTDAKLYSKKIDWYFNSVKQALEDYLDFPSAKLHFDRVLNNYLFKKVLLDGKKSLRILNKELFTNKIITCRLYFKFIFLVLIATLPLYIRKVILHLLFKL